MNRFSRDALRHICEMACPGGDFESDEELLRAFIEQRNADAFAAIVRRHGRLVMRVCRQALSDAHDAEDAFQATFLLLVRKAESIYRREVLGSWLHGVAHRVATRLRAQNRQRGTRERPMANLTVGAAPPALDAGELWAVLNEEVLRLPLKYRLPVVLCYLEGKTHEEAGQQLGWPTGTVAGRLARARDLLHRRLTRRGVAVPAAAGVALLLWSGSAPATVATDLVRGTVAAAVEFASGTPAAGSASSAVLSLTEGVLKTMLLTKIKNITTLLAFACFAAFTIGAGFSAAGSNKGSSSGDENSVQAGEKQVLPAPAKRRPRPPQVGNTGLDSAEAERVYSELKDNSLPAEARARFGNLRFLHPSNVGALAYSADGKLLASAALDGTICVWDAANGKLLQTFNSAGPDGAQPNVGLQFANTGGVAFSGDGKVIGAVVAGRGLHLWDMTTGKEIRTLFAGTQNLTSFVMSRDGKLVYPVTESSKTIELYDSATGKVVKTLTGHTQNVNSVAFSSDGKWLVSGSEDQTVRIWDLETEKEKHVIEAHRDGVKAVTVAADDKFIASLSYDNTARVFDAATLEEVCRIEGRANTTAILRTPGSANLALSADGKYLASYAMGWPPRLHEIPSGKEISQFDLSSFGYVSVGMAIRPDGKVIAHAGSAGRIRFYDTGTGKPIEEGTGHTGTPLCLAVSPDGKTLVSGGTDRTLRFWDLATNKETRVIRAHTGAVSFVAFTPDGKHVISASTDPADKVVSIWNAASGKEETPIRCSGLPFMSVALSPDGRKLCATTQDNKTHVWDVEERKEIMNLQTARWAFPSMPFTPDSKGLLNLNNTGLVVLDIETGKEVRTLMRLTDPAQGGGGRGGFSNQLYASSLFSSTDGTLAMRYNFDGTMQMVDMTSGAQLAEFDEKLTAMAQIPPRFTLGPIVAISPDGRTVATSWKNNSIRLWETATGKVRHTYPGHAGNVAALAFTRDGKSLVSAATDSTILVWNVAGAAPAEPLSDAELEKQWKALAGDAPSGFEAVRTLAAAGQKATAYLKEHVQAVKPVDDKTVAALLADLDSEDFEKRKTASDALTNVIDQVAPALRKALEGKPSLETTQRIESILHTLETHAVSGPEARDLRAIEVLEQCGTAEAREVLGTLAKGAEIALVTRQAKAALARLDAAREKKE